MKCTHKYTDSENEATTHTQKMYANKQKYLCQEYINGRPALKHDNEILAFAIYVRYQHH